VVHGRRGVLARESVVQNSPLMVTAEIREVEGKDKTVNTLLSLATAVQEPWLAELFPGDIGAVRGALHSSSGRTRRTLRFGIYVAAAELNLRRRTAARLQPMRSSWATPSDWDHSVEHGSCEEPAEPVVRNWNCQD
jgi:ATP-dependent helicase HrpB